MLMMVSSLSRKSSLVTLMPAKTVAALAVPQPPHCPFQRWLGIARAGGGVSFSVVFGPSGEGGTAPSTRLAPGEKRGTTFWSIWWSNMAKNRPWGTPKASGYPPRGEGGKGKGPADPPRVQNLKKSLHDATQNTQRLR